MSKRGKWLGAIMIISVSALALAVLARPAKRQTPLDRVLAQQSSLAAPARSALQDLRLLGAVQFSFHSSRHRFGSIEELKKDGFLDPKWPRSSAGAYRIGCEEGQTSAQAPPGFLCYADPPPGGGPYFRLDPSQAVRYAPDRRPNDSSPIFGFTQEALRP
ncbi:MAG: hypothetical protein HY822_23260 [Acidobacteria bacterium]|nr:hypothetical protein [Acidobacteriota bacterium]